MAEEGRVPDDAVLRIRQPEQSDGISWRDIQDINVSLGKIQHRVETIEKGADGKSNRSFQVVLVVITAVLTAGLTVGGTIAVERFGAPEVAADATEETP